MAGQIASANAAIRTRKLWASLAKGAGWSAGFLAEMSFHRLHHAFPMGVVCGRVKPIEKNDPQGERPWRGEGDHS